MIYYEREKEPQVLLHNFFMSDTKMNYITVLLFLPFSSFTQCKEQILVRRTTQEFLAYTTMLSFIVEEILKNPLHDICKSKKKLFAL